MRRVPHLTMAAAAVAMAPLTLAGCSGASPRSDVRPTAYTTSTAAPQLLGQERGVTGAVDVPTELGNDASKRSAVTLQSCAATRLGWRATGTARNASPHGADYVVTVFFTDSRGTVAAWKQTTVHADAGRTAKWAADLAFAAPADTDCVIAAVS